MNRRIVIAFAFTALASCGTTTSQSDGGFDAPNDTVVADVQTSDGGPDDAGSAKPPSPPDGGAPTANVYTFAVNTIYLGEAPRGGGSPSIFAWKDFGYDIDGLITNKTSTNVCTLAQGAPLTYQVDGTNGIDNMWGAVIVPILQTAASLPSPSTTETQVIDQGAGTLQLQITGLSDDPTQSALGLSAQVFISGSYGSTPAFDGTTSWPVLSTSVKDGTTIASGAITQFGSSYVSKGTFVSGSSSSSFVWPFFAQGTYIPITIHDAVFTFDHVDHADAANGTIAGVLDPQELTSAMKVGAGRIATTLCGSAFTGVALQMSEATDLLLDGTNASTVPCTGISIGIGFTAKLVANPTLVVAPPPPGPDPCGD